MSEDAIRLRAKRENQTKIEQEAAKQRRDKLVNRSEEQKEEAAKQRRESRANQQGNFTPQQKIEHKKNLAESMDKSRAKQQTNFTPQQKIEHNKKLSDQKKNQLNNKTQTLDTETTNQ